MKPCKVIDLLLQCPHRRKIAASGCFKQILERTSGQVSHAGHCPVSAEQGTRCHGELCTLQDTEIRTLLLDAEECLEVCEVSGRVLDAKDSRLGRKLCNRRRRNVVMRRLGDVVKENWQRRRIEDCLDVSNVRVVANVVVVRGTGNKRIGASICRASHFVQCGTGSRKHYPCKNRCPASGDLQGVLDNIEPLPGRQPCALPAPS